MSLQLGQDSMRECVATGGDIAAHLNTLFIERHQHPTQTIADVLGGAVTCLKDCFIAIRNAGLVKPTNNAELDAFLNLPPAMLTVELFRNINATEDTETTGHRISAMTVYVSAYRNKLSWPLKNEDSPVPTPAAPEPLEIHILSMPERIHEVSVTRNLDGQITKSETIERDKTIHD